MQTISKTRGQQSGFGMTSILMCLCLLLVACPRIGHGAEVVVLDGALRIEGNLKWSKYNGGDAPGGGWFANMPAGFNVLDATIFVPPIEPGEYHAYIKLIDYDVHGRIVLKSDCAEVSALSNDRNDDRYWTYLGKMSVASKIDRLSFEYRKLVSPEILARCLLRGIFLTTEDNLRITPADFVVNNTPTGLRGRDTNAPIKGNLVPNGAFEAGLAGGWGVQSGDESLEFSEFWSPREGMNGSACARMPLLPRGKFVNLYSRPIVIGGNRQHSITVFARSTGANRLALEMLPAKGSASAGDPKNPLRLEKKITSGWQRIEMVQTLPGDPAEEYILRLQGMPDQGGELYIDNVQWEEGGPTPFAPRSTVELGVQTTVPGRIFYSGEPVQLTVLAMNSGQDSGKIPLRYEVFNHLNRPVGSGSFEIPVPALGLGSGILTLGLQETGAFRLNIWTEGASPAEEEVSFSVIPRPSVSGVNPDSLMGIHTDLTQMQFSILQRLGIKWIRVLSPGAYFRWTLAEPAEGRFVWYDEKIDAARKAGFSLLGNLGAKAPDWSARTYFALTNIVGSGYTVGERVLGTGGSGIVSVGLNSQDLTGPALQLQSVTGAFRKGDSVRGERSGTIGTIRTAIFPGSIALDRWENHVRSMSEHYRGKVEYWEIWNEPNLDSIRIPTPDGDTGFYGEVLRRAARAIRSADPAARISAFGGISRTDYALNLARKLGAAAPDSCDSIAVHLYTGNSHVAADFVRNVQPIFQREIWNTETGAWDLGFYAGVNANFQRPGRPLVSFRESERFYRAHLLRTEEVAINFLECIGSGLTKYFYYDARPSPNPAEFDTHPTILEYDRSIKPKGVAYAILGSKVDGSRGKGRLGVSDAKVVIYTFDRKGTGLAAWWTSDFKLRRWTPPPGTSIAGWTAINLMGNPVPLDATGTVFGRTPGCLIPPAGIDQATLATILRTGKITVEPDTQPPQLSITTAPRGRVPAGSAQRFRWLAIDNQDLPDDVTPNGITYSVRLPPLMPEWSEWTADTVLTIPRMPAGDFTLSVRSRDTAGNESPVSSRNFTSK